MTDTPAFPQPIAGTGTYRSKTETSTPGMSLRDYFAGQALAGLFANDRLKPEASGAFASFSEYAYQIADAMMKERDK